MEALCVFIHTWFTHSLGNVVLFVHDTKFAKSLEMTSLFRLLTTMIPWVLTLRGSSNQELLGGIRRMKRNMTPHGLDAVLFTKFLLQNTVLPLGFYRKKYVLQDTRCTEEKCSPKYSFRNTGKNQYTKIRDVWEITVSRVWGPWVVSEILLPPGQGRSS